VKVQHTDNPSWKDSCELPSPCTNPSGTLQNSGLPASGPSKNGLSRRAFAFGCAAGLCLPWSATRGSTKLVYPDRSLYLHNAHTGEREKVIFWSDGHYLESGLNQVNWLMRDFRTGEVKAIDPRLLNVLYLLKQRVDTKQPVLVLSGFRSKKTNDMLRKTTEGVARRSFHMAGRAIDIRISQVRSVNIQRAALQIGGGGVGYYPSSNFVHLDTGPVRTW